MSGPEWQADTTVRQVGCAASDLSAALTVVAVIHPTARLVRNGVGNLAVLVDGQYRGHVDLTVGSADVW